MSASKSPDPRRTTSMNRERESERQKQKLISMGKQKGYVTYDEVNDHMPESIVSSDQIDYWLSSLGDEGIEVVETGQSGAAVKVAATPPPAKAVEVIEPDAEAEPEAAAEEEKEKEDEEDD